ncbi:cytochrome P450 [Penicillium mononematosum]|uniref:cytochrome P450 n=1 Tax=Penicillium mononematosum TaxID=268346 RepID=UPI0025473D10|nr:cytochrome P450 [Penicillium mononematosum]KAJ6185613.1 cytochrome P450 [Penicillium mononematosum]
MHDSRFEYVSGNVAAAILILTILMPVLRVFYNLFFHPLRKFPGPLLWRASIIPSMNALARGKLAHAVADLHEQYGHVVRIAPNEISFTEPDAWKDICGHRIGANKGNEEIGKYQLFYRCLTKPTNIINALKHEHAPLRRQLAHGFSDRIMRAQEPDMKKYIDLLIRRLHEKGTDPITGQLIPLDMASWYNYTTFDIIGDLAFGESFDCLQDSSYHPWVKIIFESLREVAYIRALTLTGLGVIAEWALAMVGKARADNMELVTQKVLRRMETRSDRDDLVAGLLKKKDEMGLTMDELTSNCFILIGAGSETTATSLSGTTYFLLTNPEALRKVTEEVRSRFHNEDEITLTSVADLHYMLACINESLRRYPPVPSGMPRLVPQGGATIAGHYLPENTITAIPQFAMNHSKQHFTDPWEYRPERYLGDPKYANDKLDVVQPFSFGPRNCIGRNLAISEMRLILARVLFNFDLLPGDGLDKWYHGQLVYSIWDKASLQVYMKPVQR